MHVAYLLLMQVESTGIATSFSVLPLCCTLKLCVPLRQPVHLMGLILNLMSAALWPCCCCQVCGGKPNVEGPVATLFQSSLTALWPRYYNQLCGGKVNVDGPVATLLQSSLGWQG